MFTTVFLGHSRAGTSSLTRRIANKSFEENTSKTILFDFYSLITPQIELYDSASQNEGFGTRELFIQQKEIYVCCVDLTFESTDILEKMLSFFSLQKIKNPRAKFIVAGTKSDLVLDEKLLTQKQEQIQSLLNQRFPDAIYRTTSSKTDQGIEELRQLICQIYYLEPIFDELKIEAKKILSDAQYLKYQTQINAYFISPTEDNLNAIVELSKSIIAEHKGNKNIIPLLVSLLAAAICFSAIMTLGVFLAPPVVLAFLSITALHFGLITGAVSALLGGIAAFSITKNCFFKTNQDALKGLVTATDELETVRVASLNNE
ncbi:MAG: GTPase domain-containing protein [Proteobacteria bacterium]|nr:GTPase domain-containing protein [Pseudomonadota bacterium]